MITRRHILATTLVLATGLAAPARAEDKPAEIRIGTQEGGFFPAVPQRQAVADRFAKLGLIPKPVNISDIVWKLTPGS
jgi:sulfonate transport system substrate-binding protein